MSKLNKNSVLDEMQEKEIGKAGVICSSVVFIYLLIEITYKYITSKDILSCSWEIVLLIIITLIFYIGVTKQKEMNLPKGLLGKKLPTEQTKEAKKKRIVSYIYDSLAFSISMSVITYLFTFAKIYSTDLIILEAIALFIVSLILDYIVGEYKCKKYDAWEKSLDEEDMQ